MGRHTSFLRRWFSKTPSARLPLRLGVEYLEDRTTPSVATFPPIITSNLGGAEASINVPENSTAVTVVTATDLDTPTGDLRYSILSASGGVDGALFTINGTTGALAFISAPNFENPIDQGPSPLNPNNVYDVTVRVSDGGEGVNHRDDQLIHITVTDANEAPTITSGASGSVAENAPASTMVYAATRTDPDAGANGMVAWSVSGADAALVSINASGQVKLNASANFEVKPSYSFNVIATDGGGLTDIKAVTLTVTDVNERPAITSGATGSVAENAPTGTVVYAATATDPDAGANGMVAWSVSGADAALVSINAASGEVRLNASADFEATPSYNFNVIATDGGHLTDTKVVAVSVTDMNDAPTITSGASGSVAENAPASTVVYAATATDPDAGTNGAVTWSVSGDDAALVSIDSASGEVTLNAPADFEVKSSYSFNVIATDGGALTDIKAVTISVTDMNEAPVAQAGALATPEDTAATGTLGATDADGDALTYSLVDVAGAHGTVTITDAATGAYSYTPDLDYNGPASFTFRANDGTTDSNIATVSIIVTASSAPVVAPPPGSSAASGPAITGATIIFGFLVLNGPNGQPFAIVPVPSGSFVLFVDVNGDQNRDVVLFTPTAVFVLDGATGRFLALSADVTGDGRRELFVFSVTTGALQTLILGTGQVFQFGS